MKINNFGDLKEFLNTLNETQLQQPAELSIVESFSHPIKDALVSTEDEYLTDEGYCPISTYDSDSDSEPLESYSIRPAGYVYLYDSE